MIDKSESDALGAVPALAAAPSAGVTASAATPTPGPDALTGRNGAGITANPPATDDKKSSSVQIVTRFPVELAARLDRFTETLRNGRFGLRVSRADAVRLLVNEALVAHAAHASGVTPPGK